MAGQVLEIPIGSYQRRRLTLRTPAGSDAAGYAVEDTPSCELWAGDDLAVLARPAVAWDPAAGPPRAVLTLLEADTAGLAPGTYRGLIWVDSQGRHVPGGRFALRLTAVPGTAVPRKVGCTLGDMEALASGWVDQLQDLDDDQAGFAEQRAAARDWRDDRILRSYRRLIRPPRGAAPARRVERLRAHLDADRLLAETPGGRRLRRACAAYALAEVLRPQVGAIGQTSYQALADRFATMAEEALAGCTAEVDADGDGVADLSIPLGAVYELRW